MEQPLRRAVLDRLDQLSKQAGSAVPAKLEKLARSEIHRLTGGWRQLLANHQPDDSGRCPRCSGWLRRRRWPCPVWLVAHHQLIGESLAHRKRPRRPAPGPFGRRNPTIVISRQRQPTPARATPHNQAAESTPTQLPSWGRRGHVHRAPVVQRSGVASVA